MSAIGQGDAGQQAEGQNEAQNTGMADQLGQLTSGMEEMRQWMQAQQQQQAEQAPAEQPAEGEQDSGEIDLSWLEQPYEDPNALTQRLNDQLTSAVDQRAQALVAPVVEQMSEMRRDQEARDLAAEFPELATDEAAQKLAGKGGLADQMAQQLGRPDLAAEPKFWRIVHMAHKGGEYANSLNGSENPNAANLESAGGPGPAQVTEADIVKGIVEAGGRGSKVLDFRMGS